MLIPIVGPSTSGVPEWAMIELQGKVENQTEEAIIKEIGALQVSATNPKVITLTVGYHQLEGKLVTLKKPFAILQQAEVPEESQQQGVQKQYQVVGVIKSKYLFKTRPTTLISKPQVRK